MLHRLLYRTGPIESAVANQRTYAVAETYTQGISQRWTVWEPENISQLVNGEKKALD